MVWIRPARKRPKMVFGPKIGAMEIETITHGRKFETITHGRKFNRTITAVTPLPPLA
jgi:hypothetical protein